MHQSNHSEMLSILIVDDNPISQALLCNILYEFNVNLNMADSGNQAIDQILAFNYSLIICDTQMPDMDGYRFLERLTEAYPERTIPIVLMTSAIISDQMYTEALALGGYDLIQKTQSKQVLRAKFKAIIALLRAQRIEPESSALRIREDGRTEKIKSIIRNYKNASVMFADFVNFTEISKMHDTELVVRKLSRFFDRFDEIAETIGIEKIKTIGDCYMAVSGMPIRNRFSTYEVLLAALQFRDYIESVVAEDERAERYPWNIKIGIATGFITSGILKSNRYTYDVWGNSVNLASRIEGQAKTSEILVCETTYRRTYALFRFEFYGLPVIKGWDGIVIYKLIGLRPEYATLANKSVPNQQFHNELYRESPKLTQPTD